MQLKATGQEILNQLLSLTKQLDQHVYAAELDLLNGNSIGNHIRHIIEFFDLFISGTRAGVINYDRREHSSLFEQDITAASSKIQSLIVDIAEMTTDKKIFLEVSYKDNEEDLVRIHSSLERELAYNIEHSIHHMAIIKIAIMTLFPKIKLEPNFGVAYSTVRYQKSNSDNN